MGTAPERLDVLFVTHNYPRYEGDYAGRFLARFAQLLTQRGIKVGVLAPHHHTAAEREILEGIPVWRFRYADDDKETLAYRGDWGGASILGTHGLFAHYRFFHAFKRAALQLVAETSPQVIHAHWWIPAGWIARNISHGRHLIVTSHGTDIRLLQRKTWMRPLAARVFTKTERVTVVSSWMGEMLRTILPATATKLAVAPMPPEDTVFHGPVKNTLNEPAIILCVTRFTLQKRNDILLRALERLRNQGIMFQCRIVGDGGSRRESVREMVDGLGLRGHVTLVPTMAQSALADEYRRADVTVLPAVDEGFGLALVEAQLSGCPVVGTRSGGLTDIIEDGKSGLLTEPDRPGSLADALERMLTNSALRVRLAHEGQRSARTRFSSTAITDQFVRWYGLRNL